MIDKVMFIFSPKQVRIKFQFVQEQF